MNRRNSQNSLRRSASNPLIPEDWLVNDPKSFSFSQEEFGRLMQVWKEKEYPLPFLIRDHFSAKVFIDNNLFESILDYGHKWEWNDETGLSILAKNHPFAPTAMTPWREILPAVPLKIKDDRWLFNKMEYTKDGLLLDDFKLSPAAFKSNFNRWILEGWPMQLLTSDHFSVRVFMDNGLFASIKIQRHRWEYSEEDGFGLLVKYPGQEPAMLRWSKVLPDLKFHRNAQGYIYFDNAVYGPEGLVLGQHLWLWRELAPSWHYPPGTGPSYCYLDIIRLNHSANWEHEGVQGFGVGGLPHGHTYVEFGDDQDRVWAVGQYMDPKTRIDTTKTPAALVQAAMISPDFYFAVGGEKTFHRYYLGEGSKGRENLRLLRERLAKAQSLTSGPGGLKSCPGIFHSAMDYNCTDFAFSLETFVSTELGATLIKVPDEGPFPGERRVLHRKTTKAWWKSQVWLEVWWNRFLLLFVDVVLSLLILIPSLRSKAGADLSDEDEIAQRRRKRAASGKPRKNEPGRGGRLVPLLASVGALYRTLRLRTVSFPNRLRMDHLYSRRLKGYSKSLIS